MAKWVTLGTSVTPGLVGTDIIVQVSSAQFNFRMVCMCSERSIYMHYTPSLRSFPNVAFETVPVFI